MMPKSQKHQFKARIYKNGINFCVDVPAEITALLIAVKGYIRIKGTVNGFEFTKFLVPVKNGPYRLFVNMITLKGAKTNAGEVAEFVIEQDEENLEKEFPMPGRMTELLKEKNLAAAFEALPYHRRKDILRYLHGIKTTETLEKNIQKVIAQLENKAVDDAAPISIKITEYSR
jgi:hypothetical protein